MNDDLIKKLKELKEQMDADIHIQQLELAEQLYTVYHDCVEAGFSDFEALELLKAILKTAIDRL